MLGAAPLSIQAQPSSEGSAGSPVSIIAPVPPVDSTIGLLGQQQQYSIQFRGNGEAVIAAHITFSNTGTAPMKTISFRVPAVSPTDLITYQILHEPTCIGYRGIGSSTCIQYQQPDYYNYWYGGAKYEKATVTLQTDTITVTLPRIVSPGSSGSIILYYRAFGYAKKNLVGAYNFVYESLKTESPIEELQVGVSVDDELILKSAKGQTVYRFPVQSKAVLESPSAGGTAANTQLDSVVAQIGHGIITKTAHSLQPLDSYTVKGKYADNVARLYAKEIVIGIAALILVLLVIYVIGKKLFFSARVPASKNAQTYEPFLLSLGLGFSSAVLVVGYTLLLFFSSRLLESISYEFVNVIAILFSVISIGVYAFLLLTPTILVGIKRGVSWGLTTFGLTVLWLAIDSIIVLLVLTILNGNQSSPIPMPYPGVMESGSDSMRINDFTVDPEDPQLPAPPAGKL